MAKKHHPTQMDATRRQLLAGIAGGSVIALTGCGSGDEAAQAAARALPDPQDSGIDHIVVVMMENRSFDHFLGWVAGADGRQAGLSYPDRDGHRIATFHLASDPGYGYQGCGKEDPSHSYAGGRSHYNHGAMNGFLQTVETPGDHFPVGYYLADDLPFYKGVAEHFTLCDRYFCGILASTFPNRVYMHAGQTDRLDNAFPIVQQAPSNLPTIWDLMAAKGLRARYYFHDLPFTGLWGAKHLAISRPYAQFLLEANAGTLPALSYVDPYFAVAVGEEPGASRDDHPHADIRDGQAFLNQVYNTLRASPNWERTLLIINYDEWGGFYDHVAPPLAPISAAEAALGNDGRLGFRVPCAIIGPRARRGHVSHFQFDPSSILNLIRWRFGLGNLCARDDSAANLALALDFDNPPNPDAPAFDVPTSTLGFGRECTTGLPLGLPLTELLNLPLGELRNLPAALRAYVEHNAELRSLLDLATASGFAGSGP
ncbi:alkaline phosphatase family protein [Sinimarinibacterium sp. NLF-5-8]|uniref:alkaline phosphatase family protein n=1 Tax=Sinimarinibacterium sp. NLF-5-8 TaxID=2698684 RepID=UPI00137C0FE2|nr:alkaline phosphatase family protein [Sinimarinibacterium sp. NLF-5-8]QHS10662.1 alkaline phosphatase family protein [Sinimarinibacterium sp. NLF-5-8]